MPSRPRSPMTRSTRPSTAPDGYPAITTSGSRSLEDRGDALAAADAHGDDRVPAAGPPQLIGERLGTPEALSERGRAREQRKTGSAVVAGGAAAAPRRHGYPIRHPVAGMPRCPSFAGPPAAA